ncbi:hypothetical protein GRI91_13210 [Altererythrobacter endophyticus]|uniref:Uncharacterized protein n=2 Tax=Altericroceibacterium endophyticum TaxID=1808508 RepID=A0A6I4T7Q1_9SPHN|nr:hypothetical protein [Altericroceibacterium endophyticum]
MGQVMTLENVAARLSEFDQTYTIYAAEPWTATSFAFVGYEPDEGGLPPEALKLGLSYFLEIAIANDVVDGWISTQEHQPGNAMTCQRLIDYAVNDA